MIAIIGIPGESIHAYRYFDRGERKEAFAWVQAEFARIVEESGGQRHPATEVCSLRAAAGRRWRDGRRVYLGCVDREARAYAQAMDAEADRAATDAECAAVDRANLDWNTWADALEREARKSKSL